MAEELIRSDAEKEPQIFKQGEFRKLSDCPDDFQADFNRAKEVLYFVCCWCRPVCSRAAIESLGKRLLRVCMCCGQV